MDILDTIDYKIKLSSNVKGAEGNNYLEAGMLP